MAILNRQVSRLPFDAVSARNAFAAAHSSYAIYLKNTGTGRTASRDYAQGFE
jgi:hypothetical protein